MINRTLFIPPGGVCIQQTTDGKLLFIYETEMVHPLRESLESLRAQLLETAIQAAKEAREREMTRQQLPESRVERLNKEIASLESQRPAAQAE